MAKGIRVETEFGPMEVTLLDGTRARVDTFGGEPITVRGKLYSLGVRFNLQEDGWVYFHEKGLTPVQHWAFTNWNKAAAAPTLAAKAIEAARLALAGAVTPEDTRVAEIARREKEANDARNAAEKALDAFNQASDALAEAEARLREAKAA